MKKIICIFFAVLLIGQMIYADDKIEVQKLIKHTSDTIQILLKNEKITAETKLNKIMDIINPVFDFRLMGKLTLGKKYWPILTDQQKKEFIDLFIKQLQDSYYEMIEKSTNEKIIYGETVQKRNKFRVSLNIISEDETIKVVYKLYKKKGKFKIYDIEIQDVSVVKSYSSQYRQVLRDETVEELLKKIREKFNKKKKSKKS